MHKSHFCLIWESKSISFRKAEKGLKFNFKVVDNVISDELVKSFIKYQYEPKKVQAPFNIMNIYDLEIYNKGKNVPYCSCIIKLSKISGQYCRDMTEEEYQKCLNDCIVFKGTDSVTYTSGRVLMF